ncbi:MAG TPA: PHP domain-containing protein [Candidatus Hydrogenedentes bacterium]|nr:PHP domain-containing protein [Candidatus Hydrogenedentota bacterium]HPC14897.1 PHP domain-containing protein [Candidatus Hydrogenedentota bacterium]HRT18761.1 PHP domain-containing protein [Candidatus Hydrogenedentota bacterium]HRT63781.1 PHP domain-containing protein [Candidatus Hydrogenedentota bacterium]
MGLLIDLHVHTRRYSPCSYIDPDLLIRQAVRAGLDGLVITEHHYQWTPDELAALVECSHEAPFLVMAGFEYATARGDLLIYGLDAAEASHFAPGMPPEEAVARVHDRGGVCIAAHPTRAGLGFDERLPNLPIDAIEVRSLNMKEHEQRLAAQLARQAGFRPVAASDAHQLEGVGRYCTDFDTPIQSIADLRNALISGTFRPIGYRTDNRKL